MNDDRPIAYMSHWRPATPQEVMKDRLWKHYVDQDFQAIKNLNYRIEVKPDPETGTATVMFHKLIKRVAARQGELQDVSESKMELQHSIESKPVDETDNRN